MDKLYLLGNSHIDVAWLWTKKKTLKICYKTFKSTLNLMDKYPEFRFCQSSAQYYEWMEKKYPKLFNRIKAKVKEGRWEIVGGSWVEFDCNLPSGESIVRQFLYGKRYFLRKFGIDVKICWLPDSFGFCWTLPQILKKSRINYFLTHKLLLNDTTSFIHNVFWWQGPDGSKVLSYQTLGSYNLQLGDWNEIMRQLNLLKMRQNIGELLVLFGRGDHGGGPTKRDLNVALRWMKSKVPLKIKFSTALEYFSRLNELAKRKNFPTINNELYLQFHRGTYTTQARIKLKNRKAEIAIENSEKLAAIAKRFGFTYPQKKLEEAWKKLLFNQFHDIICGTSIMEVYEDAEKYYAEIFNVTDNITMKSVKTIANRIDTRGKGLSLIAFNTLSWCRDGIAEVDLNLIGGKENIEIRDPKGRAIPFQVVKDERSKKVVFICEKVSSLGFKEFKVMQTYKKKDYKSDLKVSEKNSEILIQNSYLKVRVDRKTGLITSIYDKVNKREVIEPKNNVCIQIFEDNPTEGRKQLDHLGDAIMSDAWEVYIYQQSKGVKYIKLTMPEKVEVLEYGPIRATVQVSFKYSQEKRPKSTITLYITLYSKIPLVYIKLKIDWHASHRLIKMLFPINLNSDYATYEIPYGFIMRRNPLSPEATLEERSKWEVPGQKWIDYSSSDANYGVSILNDCKYGFDQVNNVIRVTLLRSPSYPQNYPAEIDELLKEKELTDQGKHEVNLAIFPHKGDWREALTVKRAYEFNYPLIIQIEKQHFGKLPKEYSFIKVKPNNVILTSIKKAEDSDDIILRLYETDGKYADVTLTFDIKPIKVWETDLMENPLSELPVYGKNVRISVKPCEIKSIKVGYS